MKTEERKDLDIIIAVIVSLGIVCIILIVLIYYHWEKMWVRWVGGVGALVCVIFILVYSLDLYPATNNAVFKEVG